MTRRGVILALSIASAALIAVAWLLFTYRPGTVLPPINDTPAPTLSTEDTESLFVPSGSRSQPVIRPPVIDTGNNSESIELVTDSTDQRQVDDPSDTLDSAAENQSQDASSTTTEVTTVTTAPSSDTRLLSTTPRPNAQKPATRSPKVKETVAARKPILSPHARTSASPITPKNTTGSPSISSNTTQRLDTQDKLRPPSSDTLRESSETTNNRYTNVPFDPNAAPRDLASSTTIVPPPEPPPTKKPVRPNSGLVIIVNKANSKPISKSDISNIYRDRITRWPSGERILVLNLPFDSKERQRFSAAILDMSPLDAATEWSNRSITNRVQNDYRTKNAQVVISYVERYENAIGYVPAAAVNENDNVRVVYSIP